MNFDFKKIYFMTSGGQRDALHVRPTDDMGKGRKLTEKIIGLGRGELVPDQPIRFRRSEVSGERYTDLIPTSIALDLAHERIVDCLRTRGFTGWSTYPVEIIGENTSPIPQYYGFSTVGRCGPIDSSKSIRTTLPPLVPDGPERDVMLGEYFDPDSWDGSDIFCPEGTIATFVLEPVKIALEEIRASNILFRPVTEVENLRATLQLRRQKKGE